MHSCLERKIQRSIIRVLTYLSIPKNSSIFVLGYLQFLMIFFLSKYFEFICFPYHSLMILFGVQIFSAAVNIWQPKISLFRKYLYWLTPWLFFVLSLSNKNISVFFQIVACSILFVIVQSEIIFLMKNASSSLRKAYATELLGGILGIVVWLYYSVHLGFTGFFAMACGALLLVAILEKFALQTVLVSLFMATAAGILHSEPHPTLDKRDRFDLYASADNRAVVWDPNGHLEVFEFENQNLTKLLFEGGGLQSHIFHFDGNFKRLRKDYEDSIPRGVWGLDVVLPHYIKGKAEYEFAALISAVGGQEILAAKAFGAKTIYAIDINQSAQKISREISKKVGSNTYHEVAVVNRDGRHFIGSSNLRFDVIQIYSSESTSYSSSMGSIFRPSTLLTVEALREYRKHLKPDGILQITQFPLNKLKSTFEAAFESEKFLGGNKFLVYRSADLSIDLISIAYKNDGWSTSEIERIKLWLRKSPMNDWHVIVDPHATITENEVSLKKMLPESLDTRPSTDNWPFFRLTEKSLNFEKLYWMAGLGLLLSLIYIQQRNRRRLTAKDEESFSSIEVDLAFWMGSSFSMAQAILIIQSQRWTGLPAHGIAIAVSAMLLIGALGAVLAPKLLGFQQPLNRIFSVGALLFPGLYILSANAAMPVVAFLMFYQGTQYSKLLSKRRADVNKVLWINALGFAVGIALFNVVSLAFGFWQCALVLGVNYLAVAFSIRRNSNGLCIKTSLPNSRLNSSLQ